MLTIQQLIDNALVPKERVRSHKYNPSSFGRCYRYQFWNRQDEPKSNPPDERQLRVFAAGQLFHDFVQNLIGGEKEVLVENEDVKGYVDLVRDNEVVDIKSQHSKSFWYAKKFKGDDVKKEKYSNWLQVGYYARELKKDFMRLVFVSKDDLCVMEYVQPLDEWWLENIREELYCLRAHWERNILPPAEPRLWFNKKGESSECTKYCDYRDKCKLLRAAEEDVAGATGSIRVVAE